MMPQDNQSKHRNDEGQRHPGRVEQNVEQQNVDDDGAEQRQSERNESSSQAEHTPDYLQRSHRVKVVAHEQRLGEVAGWAAWWRWHGKELQEKVQSEKDEYATQDNSSNRNDDFHKMRPVSGGLW